ADIGERREVHISLEECVLLGLIESDTERCADVPQRLQRAQVEIRVLAHECAAEGVLELLLAPDLCSSLRARAEARTEPRADPRRIAERAVDIECDYPKGALPASKSTLPRPLPRDAANPEWLSPSPRQSTGRSTIQLGTAS